MDVEVKTNLLQKMDSLHLHMLHKSSIHLTIKALYRYMIDASMTWGEVMANHKDRFDYPDTTKTYIHLLINKLEGTDSVLSPTPEFLIYPGFFTEVTVNSFEYIFHKNRDESTTAESYTYTALVDFVWRVLCYSGFIYPVMNYTIVRPNIDTRLLLNFNDFLKLGNEHCYRSNGLTTFSPEQMLLDLITNFTNAEATVMRELQDNVSKLMLSYDDEIDTALSAKKEVVLLHNPHSW